MQNKKIEKIIIGLIFLIVPIYFFRDGFAAGRILFGHDTISLDFPFRVFAQRMFQMYHDLPLWMPNLFAGLPLIDSTNLIYFYPTNLLYMILPIPLYYSYVFDIIIHMLVGAFGMFLLLKQLELSKESSLFGGFIFMIGAFLISLVYAGHSGNTKAVALMPYIYYFISRGIREKRLFHFLSASIFCGLCILCVGMQIMAYAYLGVFFYIIYEFFFAGSRDMQKIKTVSIFFLLSTAAVVLFGALQFFQSVGYINYSWRGNFTYDDFVSWSFKPVEAITFLFPNFFGLRGETYWGPLEFNLTTFYMGIIPLMLAPFAFVLKKFRRLAVFTAVAALIFFILGCGGATPLYRLFFYIPVFNTFRNPSRFLYVFDMLVIILACIGAHNIIAVSGDQNYKTGFKGNTLFKIWIWVAGGAAAVLFLVWIITSSTNETAELIKKVFSDTRKSMPSDMLIDTAMGLIASDMAYFGATAAAFIFIVYLRLRQKIKYTYLFLGLIAIFSLIDMYRVDARFIIYSNMSDYFEDNNPIMQRLQQDKQPARTADFNFAEVPNKNIYYGVEFISGYHGLIPAKYYNMLINGAFNMMSVGRLFNIKYYVTKADVNLDGLTKVVDGPIKLYEDAKVMSRAFLVDRVNKFDNDSKVLDFMKSAQFDPGSALATENIFVDPSPERLQYSLSMTQYTPNKIKMEIDTNKDSVLVLSNAYYNAWKAKVDGQNRKIYNVDYDIMGVSLEKGRHQVEFYYSRLKIVMSLLLTLLGFIIYGAVYLIEKRKMK